MCRSFTGEPADPVHHSRTELRHFKCKLACCQSCHFCSRAFPKERSKSRESRLSIQKSKIKICERCFLCHSIVLCPTCNMCPKCCFRSSCRGKTSKLLENLDVSRGRSKNNTDFEGGLHPPFQDPATSYKIPNSHKLLCQSSQEQLPVRGITSAYRQECGGISSQSNFPRVFQPTFSGSQTKQQMEADLRFEQTESFPKNGEIQDGNTRDHQNLPPTRRVGNLSRLQGCLLPYSNTGTVQEISQISCPGSDIPVQSSAFWSVHSPYGVHCDSKGGKTDGHSQGYKNPPVPRRLVGQSYIPSNLSKTHPDPGQNVPGFGLVGELGKVRTGTQTSLRLRRLPVRPQVRSGQTYTGPLGKSPRKELLVLPTCPVRQFMSLIGLLTATEKQVYLGRLHMRPIQWHLKNNWRVPESLEKSILVPRSLHPHLKWWLEESNVLQGQPLHPIKHALQIFTDASKEGWGAHLNELTARGSWSVPESKLHINYLELKAVFLALKEFQSFCTGQMVLVATDNTTVVAYINKEGGMRSGPLCALLWRILTWCSQRQVTLRARHIPGHLNVIADKLSRLGQTIQTEWSLLPEIFHKVCKKWHRPQIDLFATRWWRNYWILPAKDSFSLPRDGPTCLGFGTW